MSLDVNFPVKFPILFFVVVGLGDPGFLLIKTPSHSDHKQDFLVTYWMAKHLNSCNLDYFPLSHNPHPHPHPDGNPHGWPIIREDSAGGQEPPNCWSWCQDDSCQDAILIIIIIIIDINYHDNNNNNNHHVTPLADFPKSTVDKRQRGKKVIGVMARDIILISFQLFYAKCKGGHHQVLCPR